MDKRRTCSLIRPPVTPFSKRHHRLPSSSFQPSRSTTISSPSSISSFFSSLIISHLSFIFFESFFSPFLSLPFISLVRGFNNQRNDRKRKRPISRSRSRSRPRSRENRLFGGFTVLLITKQKNNEDDSSFDKESEGRKE